MNKQVYQLVKRDEDGYGDVPSDFFHDRIEELRIQLNLWRYSMGQSTPCNRSDLGMSEELMPLELEIGLAAAEQFVEALTEFYGGTLQYWDEWTPPIETGYPRLAKYTPQPLAPVL